MRNAWQAQRQTFQVVLKSQASSIEIVAYNGHESYSARPQIKPIKPTASGSYLPRANFGESSYELGLTLFNTVGLRGDGHKSARHLERR